MTLNFNLVDEPWIPCIFPDGSKAHLGLLDVLGRAHEIKEIYDPSPLVVMALHRLLLTILHRNFLVSNPGDWKIIWQQGCWDVQILSGYFDRWRHRFNLFDRVRPFYQVHQMAEVREPLSVQKLVEEAASGNNPTLFDHSCKNAPTPVTAGFAARYVVTYQSFALGGGVSQPENFTHAPLVRGYSVLVLGDNLFETLAFNILVYTRERPVPGKGKDDLPIWEQEPQPQPTKGPIKPKGYLDYLTWQSRRICLLPDPRTGQVIDCQILQNRRLADDFCEDPFMAYNRDEKRGIFPRKIDQDKALWRDCQALLEMPEASSAFLRPEIFNWIARLRNFQAIDPNRVLFFAVAGLGADRAKVFLWRHERLPLPLAYLEDKDLLSKLQGAIVLAEDVAWILRRFLQNVARLLVSLGEGNSMGPDSKAVRQAADNLLKNWAPARLYFSQLETPFRRLMLALPGDQADDGEGGIDYGGNELPKWKKVLRQAAKGAFMIVTSGLGGEVRILKAVAQVEDRFLTALAAKTSAGGEDETPA